MTVSLLHAIWTALLLAVFVGIAGWAYLGRNKSRFEAASRIPFELEARVDGARRNGGQERSDV